MSDNDPLESWLLFRDLNLSAQLTAQRGAEVHAALNRLTEFLDNPPPKKGDLGNIRLSIWDTVALPPADLTRAQDLYRRVYITGGLGSTHMQEVLLNLIAATEDPTSIPFWLEILDLSRPRDTFAPQRRILALSALAHLAIVHNTSAAYEALHNIAYQHGHSEVRALAVHYWGRAYLEAERSLPPEVVTTLTNIATQDKAFGPSFQARAILRAAELPIPRDNPEGVYAFKVKFMWAKHIYRTIELRSEQTLDDLHFAIQRAIDWDADHLYSFYMNGQRYDQRYAFACPLEDDHPPWTDEAIIGELGLVKKHKFLYYFDYGDSHEFEVEVVNIRPQAEPGQYPRIVDSQGQAPPQYGWYEEEEDEDEEDEEYEEEYDDEV